MPMLTIKDPEIYAGVRELARRKGTTMTQVVREMTERELGESQKPTYAEKLAALHRIQDAFAASGIVPLTDDEIYDEDGLPK